MFKFLLKSLLCICLLLLAWGISIVYADDFFDVSPLNYENSLLNYDNSILNYDNSPLNYKNSPLNIYSDRLIRNNEGEVKGYIVPKQNGQNIFDIDGNRRGYTNERWWKR